MITHELLYMSNLLLIMSKFTHWKMMIYKVSGLEEALKIARKFTGVMLTGSILAHWVIVSGVKETTWKNFSFNGKRQWIWIQMGNPVRFMLLGT